MTNKLTEDAERLDSWADDGESVVVGSAAELLRDAAELLRDALAIHDEYMSQIGRCCSQDYGRLARFPVACASLGIHLEDEA